MKQKVHNCDGVLRCATIKCMFKVPAMFMLRLLLKHPTIAEKLNSNGEVDYCAEEKLSVFFENKTQTQVQSANYDFCRVF